METFIGIVILLVFFFGFGFFGKILKFFLGLFLIVLEGVSNTFSGVKNFNKSPLISNLLHNDTFQIRPYSKDDMELKSNLMSSGTFKPHATMREIIIFKWYLTKTIFKILSKENILSEEESVKFLTEINDNFQKSYKYELNISVPEINNRLNYYTKRFDNLDKLIGNDILGIFETGELNQTGFNVVGAIYVQTYLVEQFGIRNLIIDYLKKNRELLSVKN